MIIASGVRPDRGDRGGDGDGGHDGDGDRGRGRGGRRHN